MTPLVGGLILEALNKIFPDKAKRDEAKALLIEAENRGDFKELEERMAAIVAEAQSSDPWTSRARPSFLYVMYIMILGGIPMGFLAAFNPPLAAAVALGMKAWLAALPSEMWYLFGAGYLGYVKSRENDKARIMGKEPASGLVSKLLG